MMEQKIPAEIFKTIEDRGMVDKITIESGLVREYKKGVQMILSHEDSSILDLAVDTVKFWTSEARNLTDTMICVIEGKKVVWKFYGIYARKVLHLFEGSLTFANSEDVIIAQNSKVKKNVSYLEVRCKYSDFRKVNSKIETICKEVEYLKVREIKVKQNDRVRARQFVETKLESDNTVLCVFHERELKLEIFSKSDEMIAKTEREFEPDLIKMTGRGKKDSGGSVLKTTVVQLTANAPDKAKTSTREEKYKNQEESDEVTHLTSSLKKDESVKELQVSVRSQQTDVKNNTNLTKSDQAEGKKDIGGSVLKTTVVQVTANAPDKAKTSTREEKYKNHEESDEVTHLTNSLKKDESVKELQVSVRSQLTDVKNNTNLTKSDQAKGEKDIVGFVSANSEREFSKTKDAPDDAMANQSPGVTIRAGSRFRYEFELYGMKVLVYKESIVDVKGVCVIVNAANELMVHGGGVAYYISKGAGKAMDDESRAHVAKHGRVQVGNNCVTGAGNLPYSGIIHAVGPQWADYIGKEHLCAKDLYLTVKNTLKRAKEMRWRRIALCAISAGIYGVPKELCAEMYVKALVDFSQECEGSLAEVHFVDVNLEILGSIKDAHGKWLKSPDCLKFENAKNYPSAARRKPTNSTSYLQRSTFQQSKTHSEPVKYIGQSKTVFDGSPVYEFRIHGVLKVQIYTGNLVKLSNVDAIACSVNDRLSGGLANVISKEAGLSYQGELKEIGRQGKKSSLYDGKMFICPGGRLPVKKVLHVVIGKIIDSINGDTLNRLNLVNQRILQGANTNRIRRLAMPLIGAGALRTDKDISACGDRLAKDVVEFCKNNRTKLNVEEICIVNQEEGRSVLMFDTFMQLERNLQKVQRASGSVRDLSRSFISSQKQTSKMSSPTTEKRFTATKSEESKETFMASRFTETKSGKNEGTFMTPLATKQLKCAYDSCENTAEWTMMCGHNYCDVCSVLLKGREKCFKCEMSHTNKEDKIDTVTETKEETVTDRKTTVEETYTAVRKTDEENDGCPVCLCDFTKPTALPCGHPLCKACLDQVRKHKPCCPVCNRAFDVVTGTQPKDGQMIHRAIRGSLPGFESCNTIEIFYDFPDGIQRTEHPKPGKRYKGTQRRAFLPNNKEGKTVLKLLKVAFNRRLTFTIGDSRTTGKEDQVTWNDIHHKTAMAGGAQKFGFPDPDYLSRVKDELAAKGVTEDDI